MNGYIGIPEKVNENVGTQKIGMAKIDSDSDFHQ